MKKMKLEIESLVVDSFVADTAAAERGTVDGHSEPLHPDPGTGGGGGGGTGNIYCLSVAPCIPTAGFTCPYSCWGTCADQQTCGGHTCGGMSCAGPCV